MGDGLLISAAFWGAFVLYAVLDRAAVGLLGGAARYAFGAGASAAFLAWFTPLSPAHLAILYASLTIVYIGACAGLHRPAIAAAPATGVRGQGRGGVLLLVVGAVAVVWALGKLGAAVGSRPLSALFFLGASFMLVKVWTFCKDLADGRIESPSLPAFLAYATFFPCFLCGPMHYYGEFRAAFDRRATLDGPGWVEAIHRLLCGLVKVLVVAVALRPFGLGPRASGGLSETGAAALALGCVVEGLVIYIDFSGYSDVVIAAGRILGIGVPENFRWPYLAPNLRDFWQRWHITFTRFLTQYIFIPFSRAFQSRFRGAGSTSTTTAAYLATFGFCGFWHATAGGVGHFIAWGLYHGICLSVYDAIRQRRLAAARAARRLVAPAAWPVRAASTVLTFAVVSAGWLLFALPLEFWRR